MAAGGRRPDPVKVVIINTQYIETDAVSFKSVVQSLTGQDSAAAERPRIQSGAGVSYDASPVLSRGMSFKEFERMLKELPPLDELYGFYA
ncbi:UNVERIFIED_CONTAM: VQ motif-containing protein 1 [Sesamum calycinum]|uniref:VQ motif-containing protein 1 n=1 Tax=Sesamum calycinum TaxID=2727403 RepID=A0AAW2MB39_9LAMI